MNSCFLFRLYDVEAGRFCQAQARARGKIASPWRKAGKPVIFSLSDITGILDPESITEQSDNKAVIKVCNSDNLIEAAETVTLKKDDSNSLSISKNNLEINIKAGGTKVFTMNTNSIELKKSDNKKIYFRDRFIFSLPHIHFSYQNREIFYLQLIFWHLENIYL